MRKFHLSPMVIPILFLPWPVLQLSGCSSLSAASSMRVDVDVYKGPLAEQPTIQVGELCGVKKELDSNLEEFQRGVIGLTSMLPRTPAWSLEQFKQCVGRREATKSISECWCAATGTAELPYTSSNTLACFVFAETVQNAQEIRKGLKTLDDHGDTSSHLCGPNAQTPSAPDETNLRPDDGAQPKESTQAEQPWFCTPGSIAQLEQVAELATRMKLKALYRAYADVGYMPQSRAARLASAGYQNFMAEYSNQLASRADAILKQCKIQSRYLPQSVYLRDSRPTDFGNVYVWNRATAPALFEDVLLHPQRSLSSEETADRIRAAERLFADHYWSTINTVYASGQGDVNMAFIRDAIGNWQLKSFSNDPAALLQAYKKGSITLVNEAVKLASSGAGVPKAQTLLNFANTLAFGSQSGPPSGSVATEVQLLHDRAKLQLENLREAARSADTSKTNDMIAAAQKILEDHDAAVKALQERVQATSANSPQPPSTSDTISAIKNATSKTSGKP